MSTKHLFLQSVLAFTLFSSALLVTPQPAHAVVTGVVFLSGHPLLFTVVGGLAIVGYSNDQKKAHIKTRSLNPIKKRNTALMILVGVVLNDESPNALEEFDYNERLRILTENRVYNKKEAEIIRLDLIHLGQTQSAVLINPQELMNGWADSDLEENSMGLHPLTLEFILNLQGL